MAGLALAWGFPALAIIESRVRQDLSEADAAIVLAATPWLTLGWVLLAERRPISSIGLREPAWRSFAFGLAGIAVNVAISAGVEKLNALIGLHESQTALMSRLLQGPGWLLVFLVTNGALLTEIAFRGYGIERVSQLAGSRMWVGALIQIAITTPIFVASRGLGHGIVWLIDDIIFSAFYVWRRDLTTCLIAHFVPNLIASMLIATGVAR